MTPTTTIEPEENGASLGNTDTIEGKDVSRISNGVFAVVADTPPDVNTMSTKRAEPKVGVVTVTVVEAKRLSAALPTDATVTLEPPLPPKVTVEVPEAKMYFTLKVT